MSFFSAVTPKTCLRPEAKLQRPAEAKLAFKGRIYQVFQWQQQLYDGSFDTFEALTRADTVAILPVLANKKVVVTQQEQPRYEPFFGLPGGVMDVGEDPFSAAKRELAEETGLESKDWYIWFVRQGSTKVDWVDFIFVAKNCQYTQQQHLDAGEKIVLLEKSWPDFEKVLRLETYRDKDLALQYFRLTETEKQAFQKELFS